MKISRPYPRLSISYNSPIITTGLAPVLTEY